jgi:23S rRNA (cytosine1962-C5)-methyltransferase
LDIKAENWKDYELLDCGGFEKLERFGQFVLRRPEPQALWDKIYPESKWIELADATYQAKTSNSGEWTTKSRIPADWMIEYPLQDALLKFKLKFTAFKHVGIFPEQAANWEYIYKTIKNFPIKNPKVLNLFAYTGGASLAAKAAGADVIHLDSIKQVVNWANDNMTLSKLQNIRWLVEDALIFTQREVKRGNKYNFIIMDPPSYGLGPNGERWKLEDNINQLILNAFKMLDNQNFGFILNTYSLNLSPMILKNFLTFLPFDSSSEYGELYTSAASGIDLPLGSFLRFNSNIK